LLSKNINIKIYRAIILSVVLHGYETWSLTLREERRMSVLENRVLRRIFWAKKNKVTEEWRRLHNEELTDLSPSPNIQVIKSRSMRWAGHVACMKGGEVYTGVWWGHLRSKPWSRWEDNIKMDLQEMGWGWGACTVLI
jgi:hypothetical protein